jgi:predicted membrane-bound mannosyltransferase/DNA-binding beta-propeller fold protein YncE
MGLETTPTLNSQENRLKQFLGSLTWEHLIFALIILFAIVTRFYDLGVRVMSHDETQHTYFSWLFYKGNGYQHTPLTHGPLQFHLIALSYALFGDSDFAARIPHALASVLSVLFLWNYRRYLGRSGVLAAAFLMVISPFMVYYGRYARNEALVVLFGLVTIWAILRYLETGQTRYMLTLTAATALHFATKETSFIYTAQALLFLTILLIQRVTNRPWRKPIFFRPFLITVIIGFLLIGTGFSVGVVNATMQEGQAAESLSQIPSFLIFFPEILGLICFVIAALLGIRGLGLAAIRRERAFHLAMLLGLLVLPQLTPFPVNYLGWNPLDYSTEGMLRTATVLIPMILLTIGLGIWWNWRLFLLNMAVFYAIFTIFYTSMFTYGGGFFTGLIGSLGYWLEQQGVQRGSQPWYYYLLIQIPIYEYLPFLGAILAAAILLVERFRNWIANQPASPDTSLESTETIDLDVNDADDPLPIPLVVEKQKFPETDPQSAPVLSLLGFWAFTSLAAYTIAGEKMPWLTVHITLPFILLAGWGLGKLIEQIQWRQFFKQNGVLVLVLVFLFTRSLNSAFELIARVVSNGLVLPPDWPGLVAYTLFALVAGAVLFYLLRGWSPVQFAQVTILGLFLLMSFWTARTTIQATYWNYDYAEDFLVYAHSSSSNKLITKQLEDLSRRVYENLSLGVAYDNSDGAGDPGAAWPLTWYLRNFTNTRAYGPEVTRDLLQYPIIIASDRNWDKVEPLIKDTYEMFEYIRMVWPIQDYFNLTQERISQALNSPDMRAALMDIWRDRDYRAYASLTQQDLSRTNWPVSRRMRLYIRKDISNQVWDRGSAPVTIDLPVDPYASGQVDLSAQTILGGQGTDPGLLQNPRGIALAPDGTLYVADTGNHRIQRFDQNGEVLATWGSFSGSDASLSGQAETGTFNEPWGIAVGPDGAIYVADTWNNRIQKFSPEGEFIRAWGTFGQGETPESFWGPRAVAVDAQSRVFVSDTGNKRVVVFDSDGIALSVIKLDFNEPVGLAAGQDGLLYIADTWNQQIVVVEEVAENIFSLAYSWAIDGWYGESLNNKPYLSVSADGRVFVSDPEGYRILEFDPAGEFIQTWGTFGAEANTFTLPTGIAAGTDGGVWVSDTGANHLMYFQVP